MPYARVRWDHLGQMATPARPDIRHSLRLPTDLARSSDRRVVAGVCGGLGHSLGVDANVLRLAVAMLTIANGRGALLYLVAWLLPGEQRPTTVPRVGTDDGPEERPEPGPARPVGVGAITVRAEGRRAGEGWGRQGGKWW